MIEILLKFEHLAAEWRAFSREYYGWETRYYGHEMVRCYFAKESDHTSVDLGRYGCKIQVSFLSSPTFDCITNNFAKNWELVYRECADLLEAERKAMAERDAEAVEKRRLNQIASLRRQLAELETSSNGAEVAA